MPEDPTEFTAPARARRSWAQRALLGFGAVLTILAMTAASVVAWGAWKLQSIERTDVELDALLADGPVNYLIVGSDTRSGGDPIDPGSVDDRAPLADTIMLVHVDPRATSARVLSLPRDLWVTLPSTGEKGRINAAYTAGPQELIDTLRTELDVPINHYVEIDFSGFQDVVSAIDGVPMWFDRAMRDDNSGLNVLHPGCITLDGPAALSFARARHLRYFEQGDFSYDGTGDLGRISRQQVFLRRVIDRARSKGLTNPLTLKSLVDVGVDSTTIDSGLSVANLAALGRQFAAFDSAELVSYTLPNLPRTTDGGAQIVEVDRAEAEPVLDLFRPGAPSGNEQPTRGETTLPAPTDTATASSSSPPTVTPGEVTVSVLNSSGKSGLAVEVANDLVAVGFEVDSFGNGDELGHADEAKTVIRYSPGADLEARLVAAQVSETTELEKDTSLPDGGVALYLGADFTGIRPVADAETTTTVDGSATTGAEAEATIPQPADPVGIVPGDPPPGRSCG